MAVSPARLAGDAAAFAADGGFVATHTANPGTTGANEGTATRQPVTCTSSGAVVTVPAVSFTDGGASEACTYVSLWSAATGGDLLATSQLTGDQAFNAEGKYNAGSWTVTYQSS